MTPVETRRASSVPCLLVQRHPDQEPEMLLLPEGECVDQFMPEDPVPGSNHFDVVQVAPRGAGWEVRTGQEGKPL